MRTGSASLERERNVILALLLGLALISWGVLIWQSAYGGMGMMDMTMGMKMMDTSMMGSAMWTEWTDMTMEPVSGIGDATLAEFRDQVTV